MTELASLYDKAASGDRLTAEEGVRLLREGDLLVLGSLADAARQRHNPGRVVTYIVDRNINYSNVCVTNCAFCAFYRPPGHEEAYVQTYEEIGARLEELAAVGGRQVLMQGGHHPDLDIEWYEGLLSYVRSHFPQINLHAFSPPEITFFAETWGMDRAEILRRFVAAGLGSVPGGGAEILVDRVRKSIAARKATTDEWLGVMEDAHGLGLKTSATMMFGHVETLEERVEHLMRLREVQDRTGGFTAFIGWTYQAPHTKLEKRVPNMAGGHEYLRTLAVSRLMLDNFPHVQGSWVTQGPEIGQVSLSFGADDLGGTMMEENVVSAAGASFQMPIEKIERLIRDAGYEPRQRTTFYEVLEAAEVSS
jgi:cyclic dehypoxanthinyl futalosine synthase